MKIWSIITLMIVFNFTALPSIASIAGWDIMTTNVIVNEEEVHSHYSSFSVCEKTLPKTLNVSDYLRFSEPDLEGSAFTLIDDDFHLSPLMQIFSPPPES